MGKIELNQLQDLINENRDIMINKNPIGSDFSFISEGCKIILKIEPMMFYNFLSPEENACLSYIFAENDFIASGRKPQYAMIDFESPRGMMEEYFYFIKEIYKLLRRNDIKLTSAHTGNYGNIGEGISGSIALLAIGEPIYSINNVSAESKFYLIGKLGLEYIYFKDKMEGNSKRINEEDLSIRKIITFVSNFKGNIQYIHDLAEGGLIRAMEELSLSINKGLRINKRDFECAIPNEIDNIGDEIFSVSSSGSAIVGIPEIEDENFLKFVGGKACEIETVNEGIWIGNERVVKQTDNLYRILKK